MAEKPLRGTMVFVLDTSALTDPRLRELLGASSLDEVVSRIVELMIEARTRLGIEFYTTPSMFSEMKRFLLSNGVRPETLEKLQAWLLVKAPDKLSVRIPAIVMAEYVEDMRRRITKGLRVAEEAVLQAARAVEKGRSEGRRQEEVIGPIIRSLREKYREATRRGIVDSLEDFDVVILALELRAVLVTNDEGVRRLAETLGVIVVDPLTFTRMLRSYLEAGRRTSS